MWGIVDQLFWLVTLNIAVFEAIQGWIWWMVGWREWGTTVFKEAALLGVEGWVLRQVAVATHHHQPIVAWLLAQVGVGAVIWLWWQLRWRRGPRHLGS